MADLLSRVAVDQAARTTGGACPFCGTSAELFSAFGTLSAIPRTTGTTTDDALTGVADVMPSDAVLLRSCPGCGYVAVFRADVLAG